ncbi:SRPBCC domain-containing protein [Actinocatenispora sera]|uniref:SRPBCC family protein n=1 Tax=Actinocatenispora sera TaxID=390989 RepID=UPI0033C8382A
MTQPQAASDEPGGGAGSEAGPVPPARIRRTVTAPTELVWRAFTDPNALAAWFWPRRLAPRVTADARKGGRYRIVGAASRSMTTAVGGEYLRVDEPTLLEFTWCREGAEETATVTVRLATCDDGTELDVEHAGCVDEEDRQAQERGWRDCLERLPEWLHVAQRAG